MAKDAFKKYLMKRDEVNIDQAAEAEDGQENDLDDKVEIRG